MRMLRNMGLLDEISTAIQDFFSKKQLMRSAMLFAGTAITSWIVGMLFGWIPILGWVISTLLGIAVFISFIIFGYFGIKEGLKYINTPPSAG